MSTQNATEQGLGAENAPEGTVEILAEVIELPRVDAPSFYQRNSGYLPSAGGMSDAHRRTELPRPDNTERDSFMDRVRGLLGR